MNSTIVTVIAAPRTDSLIRVAENNTMQSIAPVSTGTKTDSTPPSFTVAPTAGSEVTEDSIIQVSDGRMSARVNFVDLAAATTFTVVVTGLAAASCSD